MYVVEKHVVKYPGGGKEMVKVDVPAKPWKSDFLYTTFMPINPSISIPLLCPLTHPSVYHFYAH